MRASVSLDQRIGAVRRFGRFYTRRMGALEDGFLSSPFPLPTARLIYEIAQHEQTTATELAAELGLDLGYVSRLLRGLQDRGILRKRASEEDGRVMNLSLTEAGRDAFAKLNMSSRDQVERMLDRLNRSDQERLTEAMTTIEGLLAAEPEHRPPFILRPPRPGDMGWVVERHGALYHLEYGWDQRFEALVAEIVSQFVQGLDPVRERSWIAEREGENVGCVFLVRKSETEAQLRLLLVEPKARGLGLGKRLVSECTNFARQAGYRSIILWTNDVLHAARHLYEREGYRLVQEERHQSFGKDLVGQFWRLEL